MKLRSDTPIEDFCTPQASKEEYQGLKTALANSSATDGYLLV